jgi:hypothetical protein
VPEVASVVVGPSSVHCLSRALRSLDLMWIASQLPGSSQRARKPCRPSLVHLNL